MKEIEDIFQKRVGNDLSKISYDIIVFNDQTALGMFETYYYFNIKDSYWIGNYLD